MFVSSPITASPRGYRPGVGPRLDLLLLIGPRLVNIGGGNTLGPGRRPGQQQATQRQSCHGDACASFTPQNSSIHASSSAAKPPSPLSKSILPLRLREPKIREYGVFRSPGSIPASPLPHPLAGSRAATLGAIPRPCRNLVLPLLAY